MRTKVKGSALLWSICALLILTLVVTGILALDQQYAQEEIAAVAENQCTLYARSAIDLTAAELSKENAAYLPPSGETLSAEYTFDTITCIVLIDRTVRDTVLSLTAEAENGDYTKTVSARMEYKGGAWSLVGYSAS